MEKQYTIHDVAKLLSISTDAIRLYEKEGLVTPLRNPGNGYRYYDFSLMHRIMGIHLYRELDISIQDIRNILTFSSFYEVSDSFSKQIKKNEEKIAQLQLRTEKLRFMKDHIDTLNQGIGTYSLLPMPDCYILYQQNYDNLLYRDLFDVFTSPVFSFGNFCYCLNAEDSIHYCTQTVQFVIREPMMKISPWADSTADLPILKGRRCLYTVMQSPTLTSLKWDFDGLLSYAKKHLYTPASTAYAFYVYSLNSNHTIADYYEIFLPILEQ